MRVKRLDTVDYNEVTRAALYLGTAMACGYESVVLLGHQFKTPVLRHLPSLTHVFSTRMSLTIALPALLLLHLLKEMERRNRLDRLDGV